MKSTALSHRAHRHQNPSASRFAGAKRIQMSPLRRLFSLFICFSVALTLISLTGCSENKTAEPDVESMGQQWLGRARIAMAQGQWQQARAMIDSLRIKTPTALNAREDGILVLDSIELFSARQSADSLQNNPLLRSADMIIRDSVSTLLDRAEAKVRFYEKKITFDLQHKQKH